LTARLLDATFNIPVSFQLPTFFRRHYTKMERLRRPVHVASVPNNVVEDFMYVLGRRIAQFDVSADFRYLLYRREEFFRLQTGD